MFGKKEKDPKRFATKETQSLGLATVHILLDTKTGVNYLCVDTPTGLGLTPLLDENGNVVTDRNMPRPPIAE